MMLLIIVLAVIALLLLLWLIDRSPIGQGIRRRVLERDRRYRESLKPARPWEDDYRREW